MKKNHYTSFILYLFAIWGILLATSPTLAGQRASSDFNGDGFQDLVVGVPREDIDSAVNAGAIQIFYGTSQGIGKENQLWHLNSPDVPLQAATNDRFGSAVATGDFNKDGYADLAVGIPFKDNTTGKVLILYGSASGLRASGSQILDQEILEDKPEKDDRFGSALVTGDFNGDGYSDLAIGVPGEDFPDLGNPTLTPRTPICTKYANAECPNAGIVNVVYGGPSGLTIEGNQIWHQDRDPNVGGWVEWEDCAGASLAAGDFDRNGADDLVIGAPCEHTGGGDVLGRDHGGVSVFFGVRGVGLTTALPAKYLRQWTEGGQGSPQGSDAFAYAITTSDINKDGFDDLIIGIPGEEYDTVSGVVDSGAIAVYYGAASDGLSNKDPARNIIWDFTKLGLGTANPYAHFGWALTSGDFNRDGYGDVAVGAPLDTVNGKLEAGTVSILFGSKKGFSNTGNQLFSQDTAGIIDIAEYSDWFAYTLTAGDFNADGTTDLVIGVPFEDIGVYNMGAVNIINGAPGIGLTPENNLFLHQNSPDILDQGEVWDEFGGRLVPILKTAPWLDQPTGGVGEDTPPELIVIPAQTVGEQQLLTINVSASDVDGPAPLVLSAVNLPTGASFVDHGNGKGEFNWVPDAGMYSPTPYTVTFTATDDGGAGLSSTENVDIFVIPAGTNRPILSVNADLTPPTVNLSSEGSADWAHWGLSTNTSFDRKIGSQSFISNFKPIDDTTPSRSTSAISAYSWNNGSPTASVNETHTDVRAYNVNKGFELTVPADNNLRILRLYVGLKDVTGRIDAFLTDGSAAPISYQIDKSDSKLSYVVTINYQSVTPGQQLKIRWVLTSKPGTSGWISLESATLQESKANLAPVITSREIANAVAGAAFDFKIVATDPNVGNILQYSLLSFPAGMSINSVTGNILWTPTSNQIGEHIISVSVCDNGTPVLCANQDITVTVYEANVAPVITTSPELLATEGLNYFYDVDARDVNQRDSLTYSLISAPEGMDIDFITGVITWSPATNQLGTHTVTIKVQDDGAPALATTQTFLLSVTAATPVAPVFISAPVIQTNAGTLYLYDVDAVDFNIGDKLTYSLMSAPTGMLINSTTGLIDWTPDVTQVGSYSIVILAVDNSPSSLSATQRFNLNVEPMNLPSEINGSVNRSPAAVNLSAPIAIDWIHWGRVSATSIDRKAGVSPQISQYKVIGGANPQRSTSSYCGFSWSNGTPALAVTNTHTDLRIFNVNKGLEVSVPASTVAKNVKIYVGAKDVIGRVEAFFSNDVTNKFSTEIIQLNGKASYTISLDYRNATADQKLVVRWILASKPSTSGWISLESAILADSPAN